MNDFEAACALLQTQLGHDVQIALATCEANSVSVRIVDGYYRDGCVYVVTHTSSQKMRQIQRNPNVALCRDLFQATGVAVDLGNPKQAANRALAGELRAVFSAFYDRHVDEDDPGTCILKIGLLQAAVFDDRNKYIVDFAGQSAQRYDFYNDIVVL